ncbi:MAG TPA: AsnC family transcriptional regulator [Rhodobacteraceae bacterium]|jgi:DNA-binding Lrp family transcriptional regulator|nr:AsnC family transcriptional regulator [Paracoccaceae bacterium]
MEQFTVQFDKLDIALINILRTDARASLSTLAAQLEVSRTTVRARMEKLQSEGEILGFGVILKGDVAQAPIRGITLVEIEGRGTERIIRQIGGMPEVRAIHSTNGRWDIILEMATETLEAYDTAIGVIRRLDGVSASETHLKLTTRKFGN